jgi:hypothetical protein
MLDKHSGKLPPVVETWRPLLHPCRPSREDVPHKRPWSFPAKLSVGVPKGGAVPGRLSK